MNKGGDRPAGSGFTIVETLIVLAVTGALFASAVILINGRQAKTGFMTASNNVVQQIQQISSEVTSGYFPNSTSYTCQPGTAINQSPKIVPGGGTQGTNFGCIFLGKAIQFGVPSSGNDQFVSYALAGNKLDQSATPQLTTSLYDPVTGAQPVAVWNSAIAGLETTQAISNGLTAKCMWYGAPTTCGSPGANAIGGLAFMTDISGLYGSSCTDVCSGSGGVQLYAVKGDAGNPSALGKTISQGVGTIDAQNSLTVVDSVSICFDSGATDQSALVTVGGSGQQLTTTLTINNGQLCGLAS